jgi:hypothetical protein
VLHHVVLESLDSENGDAQQLGGILRLGPAAELNKGHDIATISTPRVLGLAPVDPGFEDACYRMEEVFNAGVVSREYSHRQSPEAMPVDFLAQEP